MKLWDYDEQLYGKLAIWEQIVIKAVNISGRLYHGKKEWGQMNEDWKTRHKATDVTQLGNVTFYENHRRSY